MSIFDFDADSKQLDPKLQENFPEATRLIETCWTLQEKGGEDISRDTTVHFWIYPCQRAPDVSRAFAVLNEIVDQVPGAIIYVEEACRKIAAKLQNPGKVDRPFSDYVVQKAWVHQNRRRVILRELEKACEQAINPSFSFDDDLAEFGGSGSGSGPANSISAMMHSAKGGQGLG